MWLLCEQCGLGFQRPSRVGPIPKFCSKKCRWTHFNGAEMLRRAEVRAGLHCRHCAQSFVATTARQAFCSTVCRREWDAVKSRERNAAARTPKTCPECGEGFTPTRTVRQKFCTPRCEANHNRDRPGQCAADPECVRPVRAKGLCNTHYKAASPKREQWSKGDPESTRRRDAARSARRRALVVDPYAEVVHRDEIGRRDGWSCGLCHEPVDRRLRWPDPMSPSLDHVTPLSRGGRHTPANVQIAHLVCNTAKGNAVPGAAAS